MNVVNAVKALMLDSNGKMLFLKERTPSGKVYYSLPGGRLEQGESEEAGLKREVFEETGLAVTVGELLGGYFFVMENGTRVDCKVFRCTAPNAEITLAKQVAAQEKIVSFEWISPRQFIDRRLPTAGNFVENFLAKRT